MKLLITLELALLFFATTFQSHNPPGWYQVQLPVNDFVRDIYFISPLEGWVGTGDIGYILHTTNGGDSWAVQADSLGRVVRIQFLNSNTGYSLLTNGKLYKTTNSGSEWILCHDFYPAAIFEDMFFTDELNGWVCSTDFFDGGLFKTMDGGASWSRQMSQTLRPSNIFFLNGDTGYVKTNYLGADNRIQRTLDGGRSWQTIHQFPTQNPPFDIHFFDFLNGAASSVTSYWTIDGGHTWNPSNMGGTRITFSDNSIGWSGNNSLFRILKTTYSGVTWQYQTSPIFNNNVVNCADTLNAMGGGSGLVRTTDGGGLTSIVYANSEIPLGPELEQNFPNPFNPFTQIEYKLHKSGNVIIRVFDSWGRFIEQLVNKKQMAGTYKVAFDGTGLSSGVYFYELNFRDSENGNNRFSRKMLLLK